MGRAICLRCNRPGPVCVCSTLPEQKIALNTRVMVLQHPCELRKQIIGTVPLLALCLVNFELLIARGTCPPTASPFARWAGALPGRPPEGLS